MKVYVLIHQQGYEDYTILGAFINSTKAFKSLEDGPVGKPELRWDDYSYYQLQEWDTDTGKQTGDWINFNPSSGTQPYKKLGWRVVTSPEYSEYHRLPMESRI